METAIGVVMALAMLIPLAAIIGSLWMKHAAAVTLHQQRMAALEKGLPPPRAAEFVGGPSGGEMLRDALRKGLLWLSGGIGAVLAVRFTAIAQILRQDRATILAAGIVSACIGLGYLAFHAVESRRGR
jgi:Domain of unknown function (DUF6249)